MDWLEYVKGELINKGWPAPKVRGNEALIAAAISIYNSYDGQFDAIVAAEAILRKAQTERKVAQTYSYNANQDLCKAQREREDSEKAEKKAAEYYQAAEREKKDIEQERERQKNLSDYIEKYETEEARDRVRLAFLFDRMIGKGVCNDDPAYIKWIGAILAGYHTKEALEMLKESEA